MRQPRWFARWYAYLFGYFWLPCPICRNMTGGQEWQWTVNGHDTSIPNLVGESSSTGICADCARMGWGCYTQARLGRFVRHDCEHVQRAMRHLQGQS